MITTNGPIRVSPDGLELWAHGSRAFPCGCYLCDPSVNEVPWHWHGEFEFMHCMRGRILYQAGSRRFVVEAGDAAFVNGGVPHSETSANGEHCLEGSLVCRPDMLYADQETAIYQNYLRHLLVPGAPQVVLFPAKGESWQQEAGRLIARAHEAVADDEEFYEVTARELLTRVCLLVLKHVGSHGDQPGGAAYERSMGRMKDMLAFVEQHFAEELCADDIAAAGGVSQREAQREFRDMLGVRPMEYLTNYRLYVASQRLRTSDAPVGEVARTVGFASQSYFTKRFRERYGHSPSEHRRQ